MPRVYATPEQLADATGQPAPADAVRLLTRASEDVEDALRTAVYETDATGMPFVAFLLEDAADVTQQPCLQGRLLVLGDLMPR
ncbi:hypothetical protein AB0N58_41600, partial [Streptomyces sp. NPDC051992]